MRYFEDTDYIIYSEDEIKGKKKKMARKRNAKGRFVSSGKGRKKSRKGKRKSRKTAKRRTRRSRKGRKGLAKVRKYRSKSGHNYTLTRTS